MRTPPKPGAPSCTIVPPRRPLKHDPGSGTPGARSRAGWRGARTELCSAAVSQRERALANHKSAKKRARQNLKRRARNRNIRSALRGAIKAARSAIEGDDADARDTAVRLAEGSIRRAATKGILSKKQASRNVSRLAKAAQRA